jgi:branched-chain amino acid transport system ATP-binding protein
VTLLDISGLTVFYGKSQALFGVDLSLDRGGVLALLGRNGVGKTTTIMSLMGLQPARAGAVTFAARDLRTLPAHEIPRCGIGLVPEGRQIFSNLSVLENLLIGERSAARARRWTLPEIFDLFPVLAQRRQRRGHELSGGEQQMLAIGRALMTNPELLILDEATEGLAPLVRRQIWDALARLKAAGLSILVVDKHLDALAGLADRATILFKGRSVWSGPMADVLTDPAARTHLLIDG